MVAYTKISPIPRHLTVTAVNGEEGMKMFTSNHASAHRHNHVKIIHIFTSHMSSERGNEHQFKQYIQTHLH